MYEHFSFKGSPNFTDFQCFIFKFGNLGGRSFFWVAKGSGSEYWAPCDRVLPYWEVCSAADTALFVAIWHQKQIRVKLKNGLLTNENEETDTEFHQIIYCDL